MCRLVQTSALSTRLQNDFSHKIIYIAALMALRRKKIYEGQMEKLGGARMTIETQIIAIENATTNFAALEAMREGARAMKNISHKMFVFTLRF